jgi:hypothetical protein
MGKAVSRLILLVFLVSGCSGEDSPKSAAPPVLKSLSCSATISGLTGSGAPLNGVVLSYDVTIADDGSASATARVITSGADRTETLSYESDDPQNDFARVLLYVADANLDGTWNITCDRSTFDFGFSYINYNDIDGGQSMRFDQSACTPTY